MIKDFIINVFAGITIYAVLALVVVLVVISAVFIFNPRDKGTSRQVIAHAANFQIESNSMIVYELRGMLSRQYITYGDRVVLRITEYCDGDPITHDFVLTDWSNYIYDELLDIDAKVPNHKAEVRRVYAAPSSILPE